MDISNDLNKHVVVLQGVDAVTLIGPTTFGNSLFPAGPGKDAAAVGENGGVGFVPPIDLTLGPTNDNQLPNTNAFNKRTAALVYWDQLMSDDKGGDVVWTEILNLKVLIVQWSALDVVQVPGAEATFQLQVPENLVVMDEEGKLVRVLSQYAYQSIMAAGGGMTATIGVQGSSFLFSFDTTDAVLDGDVLSVIRVCDGDANGDGFSDPLDAGYVLARLGCPVGTGDQDCDSADQNEDGSVDPLDVGYVLARLGSCPQGACCTGGLCSEGTQAACEAGGGVFQGSGTDCATTSCDMGGECIAINAGGCTPTENSLQVGINGPFRQACGGPNNEWQSLAYPIYDTAPGDVVHAINITHNTNIGVGTLFLMEEKAADCPDILNILWTGDGVIQGNGTGMNTRYCIANADGSPVVSPGGNLWVVALPHSTFAFDVAFDCSDPGAPGQGFVHLTGNATNCATWFDLDDFTHGDACNPGGTYGACPLVSVEVGGDCEECMPILDSCEGPVNDDCQDAPIEDLDPGETITLLGNNDGAGNQCVVLGDDEVWAAFETAVAMDVTIDLCGTSPPFANAFIVIDDTCPCDGSFIFADAFDDTTCGDGNITLFFSGLPAGAYWYPILQDVGSSGNYILNITGI